MPLHTGVATHHLGRVLGLELQKVRAIDQAGDDLAHVIGLALIGGDDTHQFLLVEQRLGTLQCDGRTVPAQLVHDFARHANSMGIVLSQVLTQTRDLGMGLCTTQLIVGAILANGGLDQRRAGQEDTALPAHQNHIVRQTRQIGTTGRAGAVHHCDLRQAHCGHPCLVGEGATTVDEDLGLVHQVGTTAFHQRNQRQLVFLGDLLDAQAFFQTHGRNGAALDGAVIGRNDATLARHHTNAHDGTTTHHRLLAIVIVHVQTRKATDLQKRRATVQQTGHALPRQQLTTLLELLTLGLGLGNHQTLQVLDFGQQAMHALGIGGEGVGAGVDLGTNDGHRQLSLLMVYRIRRHGYVNVNELPFRCLH